METVRLDKWLWSVRIFKTRPMAMEACKGGKVKMQGANVKPSKEIKVGDEIEVVQKGIRKSVKVTQIVKNRVAPKLVSEFMEDLTPDDELEKQQMSRQLNYERRGRGEGRPSKKNRRMIDRLKDLDD